MLDTAEKNTVPIYSPVPIVKSSEYYNNMKKNKVDRKSATFYIGTMETTTYGHYKPHNESISNSSFQYLTSYMYDHSKHFMDKARKCLFEYNNIYSAQEAYFNYGKEVMKSDVLPPSMTLIEQAWRHFTSNKSFMKKIWVFHNGSAPSNTCALRHNAYKANFHKSVPYVHTNFLKSIKEYKNKLQIILKGFTSSKQHQFQIHLNLSKHDGYYRLIKQGYNFSNSFKIKRKRIKKTEYQYYIVFDLVKICTEEQKEKIQEQKEKTQELQKKQKDFWKTSKRTRRCSHKLSRSLKYADVFSSIKGVSDDERRYGSNLIASYASKSDLSGYFLIELLKTYKKKKATRRQLGKEIMEYLNLSNLDKEGKKRLRAQITVIRYFMYLQKKYKILRILAGVKNSTRHPKSTKKEIPDGQGKTITAHASSKKKTNKKRTKPISSQTETPKKKKLSASLSSPKPQKQKKIVVPERKSDTRPKWRRELDEAMEKALAKTPLKPLNSVEDLHEITRKTLQEIDAVLTEILGQNNDGKYLEISPQNRKDWALDYLKRHNIQAPKPYQKPSKKGVK